MGSALARRALNVLEEMREAAREVEAIQRGLTGKVRIGAVTGGAVGYVVPAIRALKAEAATVDIHVDVAPSGEMIRDLCPVSTISSSAASRRVSTPGNSMSKVRPWKKSRSSCIAAIRL